MQQARSSSSSKNLCLTVRSVRLNVREFHCGVRSTHIPHNGLEKVSPRLLDSSHTPNSRGIQRLCRAIRTSSRRRVRQQRNNRNTQRSSHHRRQRRTFRKVNLTTSRCHRRQVATGPANSSTRHTSRATHLYGFVSLPRRRLRCNLKSIPSIGTHEFSVIIEILTIRNRPNQRTHSRRNAPRRSEEHTSELQSRG